MYLESVDHDSRLELVVEVGETEYDFLAGALLSRDQPNRLKPGERPEDVYTD
jgi:hypothetical protein